MKYRKLFPGALLIFAAFILATACLPYREPNAPLSIRVLPPSFYGDFLFESYFWNHLVIRFDDFPADPLRQGIPLIFQNAVEFQIDHHPNPPTARPILRNWNVRDFEYQPLGHSGNDFNRALGWVGAGFFDGSQDISNGSVHLLLSERHFEEDNSSLLRANTTNHIRLTIHSFGSVGYPLTLDVTQETGTWGGGGSFNPRPGGFIAVGGYSTMAHSTNGIDWTIRTVGTETWTSVTYGNGRYVAVGNRALMAHSTNGFNWTTFHVGTRDWHGVTHGNGRFVAVGNNGSMAHSPDGVNWQEINMGTTTHWWDVTYGNGRFVAVGAMDSMAHSTDGINWQLIVVGINTDWLGVTYGNGRYIAVGTARMAHSTDGIGWQEVIMGSTLWRSITYGNGRFVVVGHNGAISHSPNGFNWTHLTVGTLPWLDVTFANGRFVAVGAGMAHSTNGSTWIRINVGSYHWTGITAGN